MSVNEIRGVQNPVTAHARQLGWYVRRMKYLDRRGCPDSWFFRDGLVVIVEFKKDGKEPNIQQVRRHYELAAAGFKVHVIDNVEDGCALFDGMELTI